MQFYISWGFLIVIIITLCLWKGKRKTILEGIIIGVIGGGLISFITDADYRAIMIGPIIEKGRCLFKDWKYTSKNWTDIRPKKVNNNMYEINAINRVTGNTVTFKNNSIDGLIDDLPPDMKYDVLTRNIMFDTDDTSAVKFQYK